MPQVRFYFGASDRLAAAADLLGQRRHGDAQVIVISPNPKDMDTLDQMLWTHSALGFIPHCRAESGMATETPIVLATQVSDATGRHCLLNLANKLPEQHDQFEELIEVISIDENERAAARERFRTYRILGYPIESIDLAGKGPR